jgi:hypothetical protein
MLLQKQAKSVVNKMRGYFKQKADTGRPPYGVAMCEDRTVEECHEGFRIVQAIVSGSEITIPRHMKAQALLTA